MGRDEAAVVSRIVAGLLAVLLILLAVIWVTDARGGPRLRATVVVAQPDGIETFGPCLAPEGAQMQHGTAPLPELTIALDCVTVHADGFED